MDRDRFYLTSRRSSCDLPPAGWTLWTLSAAGKKKRAKAGMPIAQTNQKHRSGGTSVTTQAFRASQIRHPAHVGGDNFNRFRVVPSLVVTGCRRTPNSPIRAL